MFRFFIVILKKKNNYDALCEQLKFFNNIIYNTYNFNSNSSFHRVSFRHFSWYFLTNVAYQCFKLFYNGRKVTDLCLFRCKNVITRAPSISVSVTHDLDVTIVLFYSLFFTTSHKLMWVTAFISNTAENYNQTYNSINKYL